MGRRFQSMHQACRHGNLSKIIDVTFLGRRAGNLMLMIAADGCEMSRERIAYLLVSYFRMRINTPLEVSRNISWRKNAYHHHHRKCRPRRKYDSAMSERAWCRRAKRGAMADIKR